MPESAVTKDAIQRPVGTREGRRAGIMPQSSHPASTTEEDLRHKECISPEDVMNLNAITKDYLCSADANIYDIDFIRFKIRDMETGMTLFEVQKPPGYDVKHPGELGLDSDAGRFVRYHFTPSFLKLRSVGATVEFTVGDKPLTHFRMIERHFFRDRELKCFDFEFGFCIPNSKNSVEHIYEFPELPPDLIKEMIAHPHETRSDSFYFVDNKLIMHNKADYSYDEPEELINP
ncbi:protein unc-119 homolog B-like [Paramacrobiotus metropolitanus]|uniref:protein unc-119 homolog B-like n=1 Tax=Paramacrobiotus metropolitanus TaxID=2943436 RepID=UPI0024462E3C|nr:protein unc-119 homolog B-like [Paramacrobiotus metropolitanus]XP_055327542.1 protein unc-119 homolog B-like [Paramacrobiotus metropolitanus]XP_055327543.1 protein unc-119 homolog B-like [Paramacrobiotus metropolitanus]XP_055327544.1 protein unc-119 homolog B-like [Paramacrobiotus metropolitanus]XP_055327545.1 protein unc-119 homolog B-like [Paramacrobiotus metropolitanus]XP_055327546.1 protein unc-119 homolog B-like [Paramacrobiotus metropolitanus]XP_055327547.1 protein unc-119 homolog B-